jgi:hypothetical protein
MSTFCAYCGYPSRSPDRRQTFFARPAAANDLDGETLLDRAKPVTPDGMDAAMVEARHEGHEDEDQAVQGAAAA